MPWPTGTISTANLDAPTDSPASARADLLQTVQAVNEIVNMRAQADGIPSLGPTAKVPAVQAGVPPGALFPFAGASAPSGYLLCDGAAVSRTTFADLFTAIGTLWGVGDGSTTFNVPDFRDRVPIGRGDMGGTAANRLGATLTGNTTAGSAVITGLSSTAGLAVGMVAIGATIPAGRTIASIDSATQVTLNSGTSVTAGTATSIRFAVLDSATVGAAGGAGTHTLTTPQIPSHTHTTQAQGSASVNAGTFNVAMNTGAATLTSNATGGGQAHPNVQPSAVVNYIIKT